MSIREIYCSQTDLDIVVLLRGLLKPVLGVKTDWCTGPNSRCETLSTILVSHTLHGNQTLRSNLLGESSHGKNEQTSKEVASKAGKQLGSSQTSKSGKSVAGSALTQAPNKGGKKR